MSPSTRDAGAADRCPSCNAAIDESWLVCAWCGGQVSTVAELAVGTRLEGRYEVLGVLGRGGFGITYEVFDTRLERRVALKELFPPAAVRHGSRVLVEPRDRSAFVEARERFQREAAALARFNHPGIVRVYEVFEACNTAYLVMELLEGDSLFAVLHQHGGTLEVDAVLDATLRIATALDAVHEAGLLHRDVNPSNAMLERSGRVVLIDFGLARSFDDATISLVTRAVTPGYAPPEQYAGSSDIGPTCDVYGLAATTYKLLTGVTPANAFDRQAGRRLTPPHELRAEVPEMVSQAVLDGMELNAAHRPFSARAFIDRLGLHGHHPGVRAKLTLAVSAAPSTSSPPATPGAFVTPGEPGEPGASRVEPGRGPGAGSVVDPAVAHAVAPPAADSPPPVPASASPSLPANRSPLPSPTPGTPTGAWPVARGGIPASWPVQPGTPQVVADPRHLVPASSGVPAQVLDLSPAAAHGGFAPWHDGSPPVIGPDTRGRGWVTVPLACVLVALCSSTPALVGLIVVLGVMPALATTGDLVVHRHRRAIGAFRRRWHHAEPSSVAPMLFARNVAVALLFAVPWASVIALGAVTAASFGDRTALASWKPVVIRSSGVLAGLCLVAAMRYEGRLFRVDAGLATLAAWGMEGRDRPGARTFTLWVVSTAAVALGLWLNPEFWPLPG